jgi:hypothetical protein
MSNTIIREHGNMLDVSIDGKFQTVPKCTCGKCIVRRLRENLFTPFPYAKDLASTYKNDFDWKTNPKKIQTIIVLSIIHLKVHTKSISLHH